MIFFTHKHIRKLFVGTIIITVFIGIFIIREYSQTPQISTTDALKSFPYLVWAPAEDTIEKKGVIKYDRTKSFEGINVYNSDPTSVCYLIDMSGNILHTWSIKGNLAYLAKMCKNGDLLGILENGWLIRLDWNSNIKWIQKRRYFHHDIAVSENDDIYGLINKKKKIFEFGLPLWLKIDYIIVLSCNGEIKREISMYEMLKKEIPFNKFINKNHWIMQFKNIQKLSKLKRNTDCVPVPLDIFRINSIEIIDQEIAGLCKKGDLLFCAHYLDLIGILDIKKERLIWSWGPGNLSKPHHPTLLKKGNILIFDNGVEKKSSRIVELNPLTKEIVWEYKSSPPYQFYSKSRGSAQRLPNANTLITETDQGHVFEVTYDGEIVWEFYNPEIKIDQEGKKRAVIYRMLRITNPENYPCLKNLQ